MPQEPKKRHSKQRQGKRRAHIKYAFKSGTVCNNCGGKTLLHMVCNNCGYYKGRQVITKKNKHEKSS